MAYIYIVRCDDDSLYTGITTDIKKRLKKHIDGHGSGAAKYMRSHTPVELCALWQTEQYKVAARLEYAVKHLKRSDKLRLINGECSVEEMFPKLCECVFERLFGVSLESITKDEN